MDSANLIGFGALLLLALSSLTLGHRSGQKRPAFIVATGFLLTTAMLVCLNLILNLVGLGQFYYPASFVAVVCAIALSARKAFRHWAELKIATLLVAVAALGSYIAIGILHFRGAPSFDSTFVLSLSHLIQTGGPFELATDYFKRGLAYPVLHAFNQPGHFTPMITVFMAALAVFLIIEVIQSKLSGYNRRAIQIAYALTAVVIFTAPMVWNAALYIREHTLVALALGTLFAILFTLNSASKNFDRSIFWAWMAGSIVLATSRPEGIALVLMLTLVLRQKISRWQRVAVVAASAGSAVVWVYNLKYASLPNILLEQPWLLLLVLLALCGLAWVEMPKRMFELAPALLLLSVAVVLVFEFALFSGSLTKGLQAQFANLVLQEGGWGLFMSAALVALAGALLWPRFVLRRDVLFALAAVLLFFLVAKTLDLGILKGEPDLGRVGISDSLNRMWLHALLPLSVVTYFMLIELVQRAISHFGGGRK